MAIFSKKQNDSQQTAPTKAGKQSMQDLYAGEAAAVKGSTKSGAKIKLRPNSQAYRVLLKPIITEKAADLNELRKYAFVVADDANKIAVARAVEELYGVKPEKVNIINNLGKIKSRGRISGKRKDWKKAVVTLPAKAALDVYEGV